MSKSKNQPPDDEYSASETQPLDPQKIQRTPEQWASIMFPPTDSGRPNDDLWKHEAASTLHGWGIHKVRTGEPVMLDQASYLAAIEAASGNTFQPHPDADYTAAGRKG